MMAAAATGEAPLDVEEMLAREAIRYTQSVYNSEGDRGRVVPVAEVVAAAHRLRKAQGATEQGAGEHDRTEPVVTAPHAERQPGERPERDEQGADPL